MTPSFFIVFHKVFTLDRFTVGIHFSAIVDHKFELFNFQINYYHRFSIYILLLMREKSKNLTESIKYIILFAENICIFFTET